MSDTSTAAGDADDDVDAIATAAAAAVQLYLTVELGEQEQSTSDIFITRDTTTDAASTVIWPDSSIAFTVGTSAELAQGLTVKLWDDSGSTLAKGTIPALTLQTLCCSASDITSGSAAVADNSLIDVVVVMQTPASKPRLTTAAATAATAATATAVCSEQLLAQMSVSCCLRYTTGAVAAAASVSAAAVAECEVQDADMQDMLFDTARGSSADGSTESDHSAESFEHDEPEVYASVSIQEDTGTSQAQENSAVAAVSDANSSNSVIEDDDLYMLQMADDDDS
jgi:hypothetical protein